MGTAAREVLLTSLPGEQAPLQVLDSWGGWVLLSAQKRPRASLLPSPGPWPWPRVRLLYQAYPLLPRCLGHFGTGVRVTVKPMVAKGETVLGSHGGNVLGEGAEKRGDMYPGSWGWRGGSKSRPREGWTLRGATSSPQLVTSSLTLAM